MLFGGGASVRLPRSRCLESIRIQVVEGEKGEGRGGGCERGEKKEKERDEEKDEK